MRRLNKPLLAVAAIGCLLAWPAGFDAQRQHSTATTAVRATPTDVTWGP